MDWTVFVVGLLGGGAIGTVLTAVYTKSHERAERMRDRMLDAAEAFLGCEEVAEETINDFRQRVEEADRSAVAFQELQRKFDEYAEQNPGQALPEPLAQAPSLIQRLMFAMRESDSEEAEADAAELLNDLRMVSKELTGFHGEHGEVIALIRDLLEEGRRTMIGLRNVHRVKRRMLSEVEAVSNRLPRVRVVFARAGTDDRATNEAFKIAKALASMAAAVAEEREAARDAREGEKAVGNKSEQGDGKQPEEPFGRARGDLHGAVGRFAAEVNQRARPRWFWST